MKSIQKLMTPAAAFSALAVVAFAAPAAQAGEFCTLNSGGMRGCGYDTMDQCKATLSGHDGMCIRDPFYQDPKAAMASYHPKHGHRHLAKPHAE